MQSLDVTWAWGLGWQEMSSLGVLLSDCKIPLLRVFGNTAGLFPAFPWIKDVFKAWCVPSAWGRGATGHGELTPGPGAVIAALSPEAHTQLLLGAECSRNAPYRHVFHPAPQKPPPSTRLP